MESNKKNNVVYLLQHSYEIEEFDETKIIGIYSTKEKAKEVIEKYNTLPGFKDYPNDFYIDKYELDKNHWDEGFITASEAEAYVMEETITLSYLKQSMENNKIVSIYSNINDDIDERTTGFVSAISSEQVLIKNVTDEGLNDGYTVLKLENIHNADIDWHYQRKLERLYELQNQSHREISIKGLIENVNIFKEILLISKKLEMFVNISIEETETENENIGLIKQLNDKEVVISRILDGKEDGESIILLNDIYKLNCDRFEARCNQLLFKSDKYER